MIKFIKQFFVLFTLTLLISSFFGCTTDVPSGTKETVSDSPNINQENQQNTTHGDTDDLTIPGNPADNPNNKKYVKPDNIPSLPGAIADAKVLKLKSYPNGIDKNFMYVMVKFTGLGSGWKQEDSVFPRGFVLGFYDLSANKNMDHFVNGFDNTVKREPIPGRGYSKKTGFCPDNTGNNFFTNFYCGFDGMRTNIYGNSDILFKFSNFVIWDNLDEGIGFGNSHPAFVRYPEQNPLEIIIPMENYDPAIYKNIAYFTIYFTLTENGGSTYQAVFDGFEKK